MQPLPKQVVLFFVGPDMCGKTHIAQAVSKAIGVPYFKASSEHDSYLSDKALSKRQLFLNQMRFADPRVFDIFKQAGHSLIFDRGFPCEFAYSRVFKRETDMEMLAHMDDMWASIDARIIFCRRKSYEGIVDDLDSNIDAQKLKEIEVAYLEFCCWTKCVVKHLFVDDQDLNREVAEVVDFLLKSYI